MKTHVNTQDGQTRKHRSAAAHTGMSGKASMRGPAPLQRQPEEDDLLQGKFGRTATVQRQPEEDDLLQGKFPVQKTGIPNSVMSTMQKTLNTDLSGVKVHPNSTSATQVGAQAYTQGTDIHVAPGHYNPGTSQGRQLLGHELTHVVQQMEGRVQPTGSVNGLPLNDSAALEAEADSLGSKAG